MLRVDAPLRLRLRRCVESGGALPTPGEPAALCQAGCGAPALRTAGGALLLSVHRDASHAGLDALTRLATVAKARAPPRRDAAAPADAAPARYLLRRSAAPASATSPWRAWRCQTA